MLFRSCPNCRVAKKILEGREFEIIDAEKNPEMVKALMDFSNRGWIARDGRSIIIFQPGMLIRRSRR